MTTDIYANDSAAELSRDQLISLADGLNHKDNTCQTNWFTATDEMVRLRRAVKSRLHRATTGHCIVRQFLLCLQKPSFLKLCASV